MISVPFFVRMVAYAGGVLLLDLREKEWGKWLAHQKRSFLKP